MKGHRTSWGGDDMQVLGLVQSCCVLMAALGGHLEQRQRFPAVPPSVALVSSRDL